jgi:hypothetical protein
MWRISVLVKNEWTSSSYLAGNFTSFLWKKSQSKCTPQGLQWWAMWFVLVRNYGQTPSLKMLVNLMAMFLQDAGCASLLSLTLDKSDYRLKPRSEVWIDRSRRNIQYSQSVATFPSLTTSYNHFLEMEILLITVLQFRLSIEELNSREWVIRVAAKLFLANCLVSFIPRFSTNCTYCLL